MQDRIRRSIVRKTNPLNNNRGSNRRRGRGSNRQQGGNQGNRIDSRARGNAPQLLEKYKKLAHDASLNGDRVQAEYYLQFADHYFRVIADSRAQRDEPRPPQQGNREQSSDEEFRDEDEQFHRAPRDAGRDSGRENGRGNERDAGRRDRQDEGRREREQAAGDERAEGVSDDFEPTENPFTRDSGDRRPDDDRPRRSRNEAANEDTPEGEQEDEGPRFDPALLPPAFKAGESEEKPRRKPRKPRAGGGRDGEELETVN
jgi:hypothetical protein